MNLGIYTNISNEDYHAIDAASSTGLSKLKQSPAHFKAYVAKEFKETPALRIGKIIHEAILEPEKFEYVVWTGKSKNSKAWKEFKAAHADTHILSVDEELKVNRMRDAIHGHSRAARLVGAPGMAEVSAFWIDENSGENCKCRPDKWLNNGLIVDLKTTEDASPEAFAKSIANYNYNMQAALYLDGAATAMRQGHYDGPLGYPESFVFVAIEKEPPYAIGIYELDYEAMELGRDRIQRELLLLADCRANNHWPAYPENLTTLSLPYWAAKKEMAA